VNWIAFTLVAAFMQAWRNAFQAKLGQTVGVAGVTLARFLWAGPLAAIYLGSLYLWQPQPWPTITSTAIGLVVGASAMQIIATALMVQLFKLNNYAVGAGLAKSEAVAAAILGVLFFGTQLSLAGWSGVLVGGIAVILLSSQGKSKRISYSTALLGLACGAAFALTSLWIREASLVLELPFPHRAAWVLVSVICLQTTTLVGYLLARDPATLKILLLKPKLTVTISVCSSIGSLGWFSAMSLQNVPYVKTLGQVEVFFMLMISTWWLKQKPKLKNAIALPMIAIAAILVLWA